MLAIGFWGRFIGIHSNAEVKRRAELSLREALRPAPDAPKDLKPFENIPARADAFFLGYSVTLIKMAPYLIAVGAVVILIAAVLSVV